MEFNLTEEQIMVQKTARDFAKSSLEPGVIERDEKDFQSIENWSQLFHNKTKTRKLLNLILCDCTFLVPGSF